MKKTVIAVWGASNQGKSSSIKEFIHRLPTRFPTAHIDTRISGGDTQVIITIGSVKIGVESAGDPGSRLPASLALFIREGCEVIICATRTRGNTVTEVEGLHTRHGFDIVWASNYYSREKLTTDSNRYFADHVLFMLGEILAGRY
ncbi:MAG TPA: hypothetical protein VF421_10770 [Niabella sp.]